MLLAIFRTTRSLSRSLVDNKTGGRSAAKQSIVSQLTIVSDSFEAADTSQPNCSPENSQPLSPLIELSELPVKSTNDSDEWKNITRNYTLLWDWNITLVLQQQENVVLSKCNYSTNRCDLWTELTIRYQINVFSEVTSRNLPVVKCIFDAHIWISNACAACAAKLWELGDFFTDQCQFDNDFMRKPTESDKNHDLHVIKQIVPCSASQLNFTTFFVTTILWELPRPNRLWLESQWISLNGVHAKDLKKIHSRKDIL